MKITILQDYLRSGGTERHSILLAQEFNALGHRARLLTFRPGGALSGFGGAEHRSLQPFDTGIDWFGPGLTRAVLGDAPDIILCMGKTANCFAGRLQRRARARRLTTRVIASLRAGGRLPDLYYKSTRQASHLVTNSQEAADLLVSAHGFASGKVSVIRNALLLPAASGLRSDRFRARYGAGPETAVLVSVGMFRPEKNQRALIEIAAGLPSTWDWGLWLVGDGPERKACEGLAIRLGLSPRVRFVGYQADPTPFVGSADIAVHASREEALSNALIEAQALGLPAVAYQALGVGECLVAGRTGFVVAQGDAGAFRAALARLAADTPQERTERAAEARSFAREAFDRARQVRTYLDLFASLQRVSTAPFFT
ncbi:MAG TPA: glycosyltransferase [Opitutaceae bacterium]|jgi:glycosyltransferase involved in cell wall biosynthesis